MKVLAIEKEIEGVDWKNTDAILKKEAQKVYEYYLSGKLREIYFTNEKKAVLILECENLISAQKLLQTLPLVNEGFIDFDVMELNAYTGFDRILNTI